MKSGDSQSKTDSPPVLSVMSDMMFGILDACVNADSEPIKQVWDSIGISSVEREQTLKDLLVFLNVLAVSSDAVFDGILARPDWFNILLKVVDVDEETG